MQACYGCRLQKPSSYFTHQTCRWAPVPLAKSQLPEKVMGGKIATPKAGWERCAFSQLCGDDYLKKYCEWTTLRIFNALWKSIYGRVNKLYLTLYTLNGKRKSLKVSWVVKATLHTFETSVSFNETGIWVICEAEWIRHISHYQDGNHKYIKWIWRQLLEQQQSWGRSLYSSSLLLTINHPQPQIQSTAEPLTHKR